MKLRDLFQNCSQTFVTKKGHRFYDQIIWSLAIRTDHIRSNVAGLTWQICDQMKQSQIRISPVQFNRLNRPSPIIQPIHLFFFDHFCSATWAKPSNLAFYFLGQGLFAQEFYFYFDKMGPLVIRVLVVSLRCRSQLSDSTTWAPVVRVIFFRFQFSSK